MTYIINESDKLEFHTDLKTLLKPIINYITNYNWLLTNQEYLVFDYKQKGEITKLNFIDKKIEFTGQEFLTLIAEREIQIIWGVFSAFKNEIPSMNNNELPFADCNPDIWNKPNEFLTKESEIEIICFDGTYTIVKFKDKKIEQLFLKHFPEAKLLVK